MANKTVSDVINFKKDILPYRIIQLTAGVGSGKNYWAQKLVDKTYTGKEYNVLYITSRRPIVDSKAKAIKGKTWVDIKDFLDSETGTGIGKRPLKQIRIMCTNAAIGTFAEKWDTYKAKCPDFFSKLDFIVLDEAHSLTTDASFTKDPFYVERFIRLAVRSNPNLHLILMSGTQRPYGWLMTDELKAHAKVNIINLMSKCKCVKPKEVFLIDKKSAKVRFYEYIKRGERVIYFSKSIDDIKTMWDEIQSRGILAWENIGIGFADDENHSVATKVFGSDAEKLLIQQDGVRKMLEDKELLKRPKIDGVTDVPLMAFITTTKNKEGISINDTDIKIMFAESNYRDELTQMAGRVRNGLDRFYAIYDADKPKSQTSFWYDKTRDETLIDGCNEVLKEFSYIPLGTKEYCNERKEKFIKDTEKVYPYIRFDPLIESRFILYKGKIDGDLQRYYDYSELKKAIEYWDLPFVRIGENEYIACGEAINNVWFPGCKLNTPILSKPVDNATMRKDVIDMLISKDWFEQDVKESMNKTILAEINKILTKHSMKSKLQLAAALRICGLEKQKSSRAKNKDATFQIVVSV